MPNQNMEMRIKIAQNNWRTAVLGNPEEMTWGFYCYGDAPPALGGGVGMFTWFPDRLNMLEFIATTLPFSPAGRSDLDWESVASLTKSVIDEMKSGIVDDSTGVQRLNNVLTTFSQIEWLGEFTDLLSGDHPYARKVRKAYVKRTYKKSSGRPIRAEETDSFREFLEDWGF